MPGNDGRLTCAWCDQCSYLVTTGTRPGCALLFNTAEGEHARLAHMRDVLTAAVMRQEAWEKRT